MEQRTVKFYDYGEPFSNSKRLYFTKLREGWPFLGRWVLGNMLCTGLGVAVGLIGACGMLALPIKFFLWGVVGVIAGISQRSILQRQIKVDNWVWASFAGWMVGGFLAGSQGVDWGIMGSVIGLMQWFVLRQHTCRAGWWVVINAAGLIIGIVTGWGIRFTSPWTRFIQAAPVEESAAEVMSWVVAGVTGGTVSSVITGLGLAWLLSLDQGNGVEIPAVEGHTLERER
jgi:hypothetical protein